MERRYAESARRRAWRSVQLRSHFGYRTPGRILWRAAWRNQDYSRRQRRMSRNFGWGLACSARWCLSPGGITGGRGVPLWQHRRRSSRRHHAGVGHRQSPADWLSKTCSATKRGWNWPRTFTGGRRPRGHRVSVTDIGTARHLLTFRFGPGAKFWRNSRAMTNWRYWAAPVSVMTGSSSVAAPWWRSAMIRALAYRRRSWRAFYNATSGP